MHQFVLSGLIQIKYQIGYHNIFLKHYCFQIYGNLQLINQLHSFILTRIQESNINFIVPYMVAKNVHKINKDLLTTLDVSSLNASTYISLAFLIFHYILSDVCFIGVLRNGL